jgi:hypothetical protein
MVRNKNENCVITFPALIETQKRDHAFAACLCRDDVVLLLLSLCTGKVSVWSLLDVMVKLSCAMWLSIFEW